MSDLYGAPEHGLLRAPPLPDDWSRPLYLLALFGVPLLFAVHAWYSGHVRRHGYPPLVFMRLWKWFN